MLYDLSEGLRRPLMSDMTILSPQETESEEIITSVPATKL